MEKKISERCSEYRGTSNCQRKINNGKCKGLTNGTGMCCGKFEDTSNPQAVLEKTENAEKHAA